MVERFDIDALSKNPAVFDTKKLDWLNGVYIRAMSDEDFVAVTQPDLEAKLGRPLTPEEADRFRALVPHVKERAKLLPEVAEQAVFLFEPLDGYDEASWSKVIETPEAPVALDGALEVLGSLDEWTTQAIDEGLRGMLEAEELSARKGLQPIRVAVSGSTVSPPLFESLELLGRDESIARIRAAPARMT